jgi:hypothetical protein
VIVDAVLDMPTITIETLLPAPPERCFDASRDLDLHVTLNAFQWGRSEAG